VPVLGMRIDAPNRPLIAAEAWVCRRMVTEIAANIKSLETSGRFVVGRQSASSSATEPRSRQRPVTLVPGVNETPRRTSPKPAGRTALNVSVAGSVVVAMVSVMTTSLLGSAPWSPLPLTVEVIAQIVAVPSPLLRPMMLRAARQWPGTREGRSQNCFR